MADYDRYFVYMEDGVLNLGYSETADDEGEWVEYLGDAANVQDILDKVRADQERRTGA